jgi:hypothetical protein
VNHLTEAGDRLVAHTPLSRRLLSDTFESELGGQQMAIADLTEVSVRRALAQFRELSLDAFLELYGFGKARGYFVVDGDLRCDSKAIAGAAHGFLRGMAPLGPNDFSGGERTVARHLREFGFEVTGPTTSGLAGIRFEIGKLYNRRRDIHDVYGGCARREKRRSFSYSPEKLVANSGTATDPRKMEPSLTRARANTATWNSQEGIARSVITLGMRRTCHCSRKPGRAVSTDLSDVMRAAAGLSGTCPTGMEQSETQSSSASYLFLWKLWTRS